MFYPGIINGIQNKNLKLNTQYPSFAVLALLACTKCLHVKYSKSLIGYQIHRDFQIKASIFLFTFLI